MSGIDNAAAAFDADSGAGKPSAKEVVSVEDIFHNSLKGVEVDEGSPEQGGGDDTLPEGYVPPEGDTPRRRTRARQEQQEEDEQDPEEALYVDPDDPEADDEDPDDPEADEDEDDPEADEDEDEDVLDDKAMDKMVEITVDGEKKKVKLREAVDGYIRTDTFHQRMNGLNEARQLLEGEAHKIVARRVEVNNLYNELETSMKALLPKDVDWDKLYAENPQKARSLQKSYEEIEQRLTDLRGKRDRVNQEAAEQDRQRTKTYVDEEAAKFVASNPHWRGQDGDKKRQKDLESMARTAKAVGFRDEEILQTYDSRMLQVLLKASKYDRMVAARPKPNKGKTPARPGAGRVPTAPRGTRRASAPASGGSSIERAGAVFTELIKPRR